MAEMQPYSISTTKNPLYVAIVLILSMITFVLVAAFFPYEPKVNYGFAILIFAGVLWITEVVHITVTAILIPILAVLFGLMTISQSLAGFASPVIFFFFGGFALSAALSANKIDLYIANKMLRLARGNIVLGFIYIFITTAFLSMWMSNIATTALLLPITLGVLSNLDPKTQRNSYVFVLLGIGYSASIGGMATPVGAAVNNLAANALGLEFFDWVKIGLPFVLFIFPIMILALYMFFKPSVGDDKFDFNDEKMDWDYKSKASLVIFLFTATAWVFSGPLSRFFGSFVGSGGAIASFSTLVSLACVIALCVSRAVTWRQIEKSTSWGVLMLFGGGIALSRILKDTGTSYELSKIIQYYAEGLPFFVVALIIAFFIVFFTELASNTASGALFIPIFISFAEITGNSTLAFAAIITIGVSTAFMLPVATPPNAMVHATGYIKTTEMIKTGFVLNIASAFGLACLATFLWRNPSFLG